MQIWRKPAGVEQGRHWSSALIWLCSLLFGGTLICFTAKIDQTVTVRPFEPSGSVRDVDLPVVELSVKFLLKMVNSLQAIHFLMLKLKDLQVAERLWKYF